MLEEARGEFFRCLEVPFLDWQQEDTTFPVIECRLRYKAVARYDDLLTIEVWLTEMARVRLNFAYRIVNQAKIQILEASTSHACTSVGDKPKRLPEELVRVLQPYLHPA
jgi:acyl-CoA thioester hydrolase